VPTIDILVRLARTGLRKGLLEGSRGWLIAGLGAGAIAVARRVVSSHPEVVFRSELKPGEGLAIRTLPPKA
jgi:hypothetical protein